MKSRALRPWVLFWLVCVACSQPAPKPAAAPAPVAEKPVEPTPAPTPVAAEPPPPTEPVLSPGFAESMVALRPPSAQASLQALAAAPDSAQAYADAALAFASTDVPGMVLIWGMTYQAMGGGKQNAEVAAAFAKVLAERISIKREENSDRVDYNLRLAPGQMPARQDPDGSVHAPLAHVFEALFGTVLVGFRPPWSVEEYYDALSSWAGLVSSRGTPLDEALELDAWLVNLAKAGHLEAYCYELLGPAFPAELKAYKAGHATELKALKNYLKSAALQPKRAAMPDDLVRVQ